MAVVMDPVLAAVKSKVPEPTLMAIQVDPDTFWHVPITVCPYMLVAVTVDPTLAGCCCG